MAAFSKVGVFQFLVIILCSLQVILRQAQAAGKTLPDRFMLKSCDIGRIYQFGASKSDTGNRRIENPKDSCNLPPYGESYLPEPTGRCSDGLLMIDYIATAAGINFLNPSLNASADFSNGANFAVGGATALPKEDSNSGTTNSSLEVQVNWLVNGKSKYFPTCQKDTYCGQHKNTLFVVGETGGNDYTNYFFSGKSIEDAKNILMPQIVQNIVKAVNVFIGLGANRLIVPGQFPMGCFPVFLNMFQTNNTSAYDGHGCLIALNNVSVVHDNYLKKALNTLEKENPNTKIVYVDYYNAFIWVLDNAADIGLDTSATLKSCCGGGGKYNFNTTRGCGSAGALICPDPAKFIFWDGVHLTQKANKYIATWLIADFVPKLGCPMHAS